MSRLIKSISLVILLLAPLAAASDDQQKAQKLLNKVSAMAADPNARRAVSLALAQALSAPRAELVQQRQAMDLNYGELFLAHQLVKAGARMEDISAARKAGKNIWQIAGERSVNWKQIASDAKKLNSKINDNLLTYFSKSKTAAQRDAADAYDPFPDTVRADNNVSQEDLDDAQKRYLFLHDHAGVVSDSNMDPATQNAARASRPDPIREAGPTKTPSANASTGPKN